MDSWRWQEESPTESLIRESLEDTSVIIDDADNLEFLGETRQDLRFPLSARQEPQGGRLENDLAQSQSRGGQPLSSFLEDRDWSSRDNDDFCLETGRKRADCQDDVLVDCVLLALGKEETPTPLVAPVPEKGVSMCCVSKSPIKID